MSSPAQLLLEWPRSCEHEFWGITVQIEEIKVPDQQVRWFSEILLQWSMLNPWMESPVPWQDRQFYAQWNLAGTEDGP